jgi:hypothetical protein
MGTAARLLWVGVVACLAGCQSTSMKMYEGPPLPRERVAWLAFAQRDVGLQLKALDGRPLGTLYADHLEILPGQHQLAMEVSWSNRHRDRINLPFTLEANQTYLLRAEEREPPRPSRKKGTPAEELAGGAAEGFVGGAAGTAMIYTAPFWLPALIGYYVFVPPPEFPPARHSMHVYITQQDGRAIAQWNAEAPQK